jgi:hypothetical protein
MQGVVASLANRQLYCIELATASPFARDMCVISTRSPLEASIWGGAEMAGTKHQHQQQGSSNLEIVSRRVPKLEDEKQSSVFAWQFYMKQSILSHIAVSLRETCLG